MLKERPVLFSSEMVRALLDGRKTMTRRVVKPQPPQPISTGVGMSWEFWPERNAFVPCGTLAGMTEEMKWGIVCPYGQPGDRLWVKETFSTASDDSLQWVYRANGCAPLTKWRPSIFMPRVFSRITLEVTGVKVERVQDIRDDDALSEGVFGNECTELPGPHFADQALPSMCFANLWESINAKRGYGWDKNPWVWAISFKRITP